MVGPPSLSDVPHYFWSLKRYTSSEGEARVSPGYYELRENGAVCLYQIWHPTCPASEPTPAILRAKELAGDMALTFRLSPEPLAPYPS